MNDVGSVYLVIHAKGDHKGFSPRERDKLLKGGPYFTEDIM